MTTSPTASPAAIPGTAAIRLGIALLGAIGFALSYDALRQMAVASHIAGPLTYAFPFVIDGFIAIGIGALLILRTAPLPSRLYVWVLVGIATLTSIWANALHAVRLNEQIRHTGLHLGDPTVGGLSAIAPLALAGAVHLYLVVRRQAAPLRPSATGGGPGPQSAAADTETYQAPAVPESSDDVAEAAADVAETADRSAKPKGRQPSATLDELLAIGRQAPRGRDGRISRRAVETAIRAEGHSVGKDRLAEATRRLQTELDSSHAPA